MDNKQLIFLSEKALQKSRKKALMLQLRDEFRNLV